ncbi:MAG: tRNA 4-thiouridine(8) synthase ThiI [Clostridia bacterium]|nr:tRNA 4-thiouridine(8) synthase ThiI [Clostridia bacterium]
MARVIIVRYGEIFLKGKNKSYFESLLVSNIKNALNGLKHTFNRSQGRFFVENFSADVESEIVDRLKKVFGIYSLSLADKVETKFEAGFPKIRESIKALALNLEEENTLKTPKFRVTVKRADKRIPLTSAEIAADFGGIVIENSSFTVDLKHFDYEFFVDIRENGWSFVYSNVIMGAGGLPVGCSNRGLLLLSGGIDSPVAAYMMAKRGMKLVAIHFASPPYTSERAKQKVVELRDIVSAYTTEMKLLVVPFTDIQLAIHEHCPAEYMITIMRRFMMRIASIVAEQYDCKAIITGESLGQVASQTVESMTSTEDTALYPIFRPLIAFDKEETMTLAKRIGTFETSIEPFEDCCTIFLPKNPSIKPKLDTVRRVEKDIKNADELVAKAIENIEIY